VKTSTKVALAPVVLVVGVALIAVAIGYMLPQNHVATRTALIPAPADSVWKAITDVAAYPAWRSDVKDVEMVASPSGRTAWREGAGDDVIPMEVVESEQPTRLVVRIASDSLPFGGAWTYRLSPEGTGTRITITEAGAVYNPIFRFVSRYITGHTKTMDDYLRALGRKFGAEVEPVDAVTD
jgi:uncharacterized protein YndB with AHSA1/START domain